MTKSPNDTFLRTHSLIKQHMTLFLMGNKMGMALFYKWQLRTSVPAQSHLKKDRSQRLQIVSMHLSNSTTVFPGNGEDGGATNWCNCPTNISSIYHAGFSPTCPLVILKNYPRPAGILWNKLVLISCDKCPMQHDSPCPVYFLSSKESVEVPGH